MNRRLDDAVERWLAAEAAREASASEPAEAALTSVFRHWPAPEPPRGFALAVMRRAGLARRRADAFASRWVHAAIASALGLAAVSVSLMPVFARLARLAFEPADIIGWGSRTLVAATQALAGALDVWGFLSRLGGALGAVVATPQVALSLVLVVLCAGGALRALDRLITAERSF